MWIWAYVTLFFYNIQCLNPLEFVYMKQQQNLFEHDYEKNGEAVDL